MIRTRIAVLAVIVALLAGAAIPAAGWNGLTVDGDTFGVTITEHYTGYSGNIAQYGSDGITLVGGANVYWCLPKITAVGGTNPMYGVCIDTNQFTGTPQQLRQGWDDPGLLVNNPSRYNGTVLDETAWNHTTYLFSKYQNDLSTWWGSGTQADLNKSAALQLAIWEVMSGDATTGVADWGNGYFRASSVSGDLKTLADSFVAEAFDDGFSSDWSQAYYLHDNQDYLVYAPATVPNPIIPEIPAMILGPLGLVALGALRRKLAK